MQNSDLSLKWLKVFQLVAQSGTVQTVAADMGLSVSTVSHHLSKLEENLGVRLLDHSRRPMVLTPSGTVFLQYIEEALQLIRRAEMELVSGNPVEARNLRLAIVDDFDSEVAPELAQNLSVAMPKCTFQHITRPSHEVIALLRNQKLDIGVATRPMDDLTGLVEYPLLRDPFVLAVPASCRNPSEEFLTGQSGLPFLRYSSDQIIGGLIAAQLSRLRISLPSRIELESNPSILGMVAAGSGWAITTPASFARSKRFSGQITLHRFPGKGFSRTLSLFTTETYSQPVVKMVLNILRRLLRQSVVNPAISERPWLKDSIYLLPENEAPS